MNVMMRRLEVKRAPRFIIYHLAVSRVEHDERQHPEMIVGIVRY